MKRTLFTAALGALGMYYFDPQLGRTRRAKLQDQLGGKARRSAREVARKAEYAKGHIEGLRHATQSDSPPPSDEALTAKVESEVLNRWNYPKGQISVNSVDGIVELRGALDDESQISSLEQDVRKVTGVVDVHNYLHVKGSPAPNKEGALQAGKGSRNARSS